MDIFCFGDSITRGENDAARGGWVDRLKVACIRRYLREGGGERCVFNLGIGGETTREIKRRFAAELGARRDPAKRSVVILEYGANDAARIGNSFAVPVGAFSANLSGCIDEARRRRCEVFLLNITPVAGDSRGVRSPGGKLRKPLFIRRYNAALSALASEKKAVLIDVHARFATHDLCALFGPDGVHPNAAGHALIYRAVKECLETRRT